MEDTIKKINRPLFLWIVIAVLAVACFFLFANVIVMRYQMYSLVSSSAYQSSADGRMALSYLALIDGEHADYDDEAERLERLRDLIIQRMWLSHEQLTGLYDHWGYQVGGYPLENYLETEEYARLRSILEERGILADGASNQAR